MSEPGAGPVPYPAGPARTEPGLLPGQGAGRALHDGPAADLPGAVPEQEPGGLPEQRGAGGEPAAHAEDVPAPPEPLGVDVPPTGNAYVDAALARLADADALPTRSHIEVYEDVHHGLRDALAALDENRS